MAATADSSSNPHPAGATGVPGDAGNSPQFLRSNFPSPWAQVVRGEPESISALRHSPPSSSSSLSSLATSVQEQNSFPDCFPSQAAHSSPPPPLPQGNFATGETSDASSVNAAAQIKKPVWNKPSNGTVEVSPVMGAVSWPALSESTKSSSKFQSESLLKAASDGSNSSSQEPANPPLPQKHATTNAKPNSSSSHTMPVRQRYNRRGNNSNYSSSIGGGPPRGGFVRPSQTPPPPSFPAYQVPPNNYANLVPPMADTSLRDPSILNNNWDTRPVGGFISQQNPVNEHRGGTTRRGNFNPNIRGDGIYHHSRARPDDERGNYGNARDVHMQQHQQRPHPRSFVAHPSSYATPAPYFSPQPVRAYGNHLGYQEFVYFQPIPFEPLPLEHYRGPQFMPQLPIIQPYTDPHLPTLLINQIDYYFCDANLVKDHFLRSNMDEEGWVSIDVIANFPRVKNLTGDFRLILDSMKSSTVVEVQDNKMRRRDDWIKWIPNQNQMAADSQSLSKSNQDMMITLKNLKIEEVGSSHASPNGDGDSKAGDAAAEVRELPNGEFPQNTNSSK